MICRFRRGGRRGARRRQARVAGCGGLGVGSGQRLQSAAGTGSRRRKRMHRWERAGRLARGDEHLDPRSGARRRPVASVAVRRDRMRGCEALGRALGWRGARPSERRVWGRLSKRRFRAARSRARETRSSARPAPGPAVKLRTVGGTRAERFGLELASAGTWRRKRAWRRHGLRLCQVRMVYWDTPLRTECSRSRHRSLDPRLPPCDHFLARAVRKPQ